tara:strand:- start:1849 stop:2460 length:612 start_codon:yes stop_codon:yes gene_type:complete
MHTITENQNKAITKNITSIANRYKANENNFKIVKDEEGNEEKKYINWDKKIFNSHLENLIEFSVIEETEENREEALRLITAIAKSNNLYGRGSYINDEQIDKDLENLINSYLETSLKNKKYLGTHENKQFNRLTLFRNKIYYVCSNNTLKDFTLNPKFMNLNNLFGTTTTENAKTKATLKDVLKVSNIIEFIKSLKPVQATTK